MMEYEKKRAISAENALPFLKERFFDAAARLDDEDTARYAGAALVATNFIPATSGVRRSAAYGPLALTFYKKLKPKHYGWPETKRILWGAMYTAWMDCEAESNALPFIEALVNVQIPEGESGKKERIALVESFGLIITYSEIARLPWMLRHVANHPDLFESTQGYPALDYVRHRFVKTQNFFDLFKTTSA